MIADGEIGHQLLGVVLYKNRTRIAGFDHSGWILSRSYRVMSNLSKCLVRLSESHVAGVRHFDSRDLLVRINRHRAVYRSPNLQSETYQVPYLYPTL